MLSYECVERVRNLPKHLSTVSPQCTVAVTNVTELWGERKGTQTNLLEAERLVSGDRCPRASDSHWGSLRLEAPLAPFICGHTAPSPPGPTGPSPQRSQRFCPPRFPSLPITKVVAWTRPSLLCPGDSVTAARPIRGHSGAEPAGSLLPEHSVHSFLTTCFLFSPLTLCYSFQSICWAQLPRLGSVGELSTSLSEPTPPLGPWSECPPFSSPLAQRTSHHLAPSCAQPCSRGRFRRMLQRRSPLPG